MRKLIICLIAVCSALAIHAKTWSVVGDAFQTGTTVLQQDATNPNVYKYVGTLNNKSFKLFDGVDTYIPVCGLNDPFDQQVGMEKQTDATQAGFRVSYVHPTALYRITLTDGTAPKVIVEKAVPYAHLYLIGGPVNTHDPNWQLGDARELEKDPTNPFVFYYRGFLKYNKFGDERGAIKLLTSNTSWSPAYHPLGTTNTALAQAAKMRLEGADTKWEIPADGTGNGYYIIKVNTLDETITVEKFQRTDVDYPTYIYLSGDAMPCGWVNGEPEVMTPTNILEGKYSWTGNVLPGQFKLLKVKGTWGSCYVSTVQDQHIEYGKLFPLVYEFEYYNNGGNDYKFVITEAAKCTINVDLSTMKIVVNKESQTSTNNVNSDTGITIIATGKKIIVSSSSSSKKNYTVFSVDGRKVYSNTFVYRSEISLPKGYYIVTATDSNGKQCEKKNVRLS